MKSQLSGIAMVYDCYNCHEMTTGSGKNKLGVRRGVLNKFSKSDVNFIPLSLTMGIKSNARDWEYCYKFTLIYKVKPFLNFSRDIKNLLIKYHMSKNWDTLQLIFTNCWTLSKHRHWDLYYSLALSTFWPYIWPKTLERKPNLHGCANVDFDNEWEKL